MKHIKLTFFNTEIETYGVNSEYTVHRSTTPKKSFELSYNTDNWKRALSFAKRKMRALQKTDPALGCNTCIEFVGHHDPKLTHYSVKGCPFNTYKEANLVALTFGAPVTCHYEDGSKMTQI